MLKIESLTKSYGENTVLRDLAFTVNDTGIYAIMGSSGIGKTTLLNIIAGLEPADNGNVINTFQKISYKFQLPHLFPWLTAAENIKVVSETANASALLEAVGLAEAAEQYPNELSGGMQQRVALARALAYNGDLLLLDEPFSAVDEETKKQLIALIKRYGEAHAVILVTHDRAEAEALDAQILELT